MGQKVHPYGFRLGIIKDWESNWYAQGKDYTDCLHEDIKIRTFLLKELSDCAVSKINIERLSREQIKIIIFSGRPGPILGQEGANLEVLIKKIKILLKNRKLKIEIKVVLIKKTYVDAQLVANNIAKQIANRASFRNVQKLAIRQAMKSPEVKGIKTKVSGRLGGVEMAREEGYTEGTVPLATLRSNIDYAQVEAATTYGRIGVKVWICKGEVLPEKKKSNKENE